MRKSLPLLLLLSTGAELLAEDGPLIPAARVRVTIAHRTQLPTTAPDGAEAAPLALEHGATVTGSALDQDRDSLTLQLSDGTLRVRVPREAIAEVHVSRGRGSRGKGALIGLGVGFAAGFLLGLPCTESSHGMCGPEMGLVAGSLLALPCGLVGLAIPPGERWEPVVARPQRLSLGLTPRRGGLGVALAVGF